MTHQRSREDAFTLIELLVVVIILGILAAIAIPVFLKQREKAWDVAVRSDLRNAAAAQIDFLSDDGNVTGLYADSLAVLTPVSKFSPTDGVVFDVFEGGDSRFCMVAHFAVNSSRYWAFDSDVAVPVLVGSPVGVCPAL